MENSASGESQLSARTIKEDLMPALKQREIVSA